jgi:dTDP-4-dehydrorhamnose 3,5-epimerase
MGPFEIIPTPIGGCVEIIPRIFEDERGRFIKLFHQDFFMQHQLNPVYEEQYYSVSSHRVLRGLHFQIPPHAHVKLVSCISGSILDVVVDLRRNSATFKKVSSLELNAQKGNMLYVPEGLAHGFYVLSSQCIFLSMNSRKFSAECDSAIYWDSIGFTWPDRDPVVSEKDKNAIPLNSFISPF